MMNAKSVVTNADLLRLVFTWCGTSAFEVELQMKGARELADPNKPWLDVPVPARSRELLLKLEALPPQTRQAESQNCCLNLMRRVFQGASPETQEQVVKMITANLAGAN